MNKPLLDKNAQERSMSLQSQSNSLEMEQSLKSRMSQLLGNICSYSENTCEPRMTEMS